MKKKKEWTSSCSTQRKKIFDFNLSNIKWRLCLWKAYFDQGYALTNWVKWIIAFFGMTSLDVNKTLYLGIVWGVSCFLLGWGWYRYDWVKYDKEIQNHFNPFVGEVRDKFGITKTKIVSPNK